MWHMRIRCFSTLVYGMHWFACCQCAHYANTAELHPAPLLVSCSLRILSSLAVLPSVIGSYGHLEHCLVKKSMMWLCDPLIWWHFHTFFEEEFNKEYLEFANGLDVEGVWAVLNLNAWMPKLRCPWEDCRVDGQHGIVETHGDIDPRWMWCGFLGQSLSFCGSAQDVEAVDSGWTGAMLFRTLNDSMLFSVNWIW